MQIPALRRQGGFSLVELSIATAIYSMGLGSLSLMMLLAVQGTTEARLTTTAAMHMTSLAEMILMNSDAAGHYALNPQPGIAACEAGHACSAEEMAIWQLTTWREQLASELPHGTGLVCRDGTPEDGDADNAACDGEGGDVIKVFWQPTVAAGEADHPPGRQVLRLP